MDQSFISLKLIFFPVFVLYPELLLNKTILVFPVCLFIFEVREIINVCKFLVVKVKFRTFDQR